MPNNVELLLPKRVGDPGSNQLSPRPDTLEGKVLGFLWNSKPNGELLFDEFVNQVGESHALKDVKRFRKPSAAIGAKDETLDELQSQCDAAVVALGD